MVTVLSNSGGLAWTSSYDFNGWRMTADSSGDRYLPGESFVMGHSNVTLYTAWEYNGPI
jgi:hypothetical protein